MPQIYPSLPGKQVRAEESPNQKEKTTYFALALPWPLLVLGVWFGLLAGFVEGIGLLIFQRINWARWGATMHVSEEILWIAPLVDLIFFLLVALAVGLLTRISARLPAMRIVVFVLTFLACYDWLTLTGRLYRLACILLAMGIAVALVRWFGPCERDVLSLWKKTAPWLVITWFFVFAAVQGGKQLIERSAVAALPAASSASPNVLVIVVDTLRADHVSAYGYKRPTTPNIDRIAAQGVLFENAISTSSWSLPSHVSLITGAYLFQHGVGNVQPEPWPGWGKTGMGGLPTLGESLEHKGYRTGAFSANRTYFARDLGFGRGFLHFEDYFQSASDMFLRTLYGREFSRVYLSRSDHSLPKRILRSLGWTALLDQDAEGSGSYGGAFGIRKRANVVNQEVLQWVDRDRQRPFFAFLNYFDVHDPYGGPKNYPKPSWKHGTPVAENDDTYDDGVKYVDDNIGALMAELEKRGLLSNTVVVITSDHGEALGQHHLETHGRALYWELIHVPLVIWYPDHVPSGLRLSRPITNAALPATILELIGSDNQTEFTLTPLSELWKSQPPTEWHNPLSELAQNKYPGLHDKSADNLIPTATTGSLESLVTSRWQMIRHETMGSQLYDLTQDSAELTNLISTPTGKAAAAELESQISRIKASQPPKGR